MAAHPGTRIPRPRRTGLGVIVVLGVTLFTAGASLAAAGTWTGLVINEFGAENDSLVADGFGEYDDWIELYNDSASTLSLDGLYLTDDLSVPTTHILTGGMTIDPGEHLLLWADSQTAQGVTHLGFRLNDDGEEIGLFEPDGLTPIDTFTYGVQVRDKCMARFPDGDPQLRYSYSPTPGSANAPLEQQRFFVLNEAMPDNVTTIFDESVEFEP